jgi:hypothetical protein
VLEQLTERSYPSLALRGDPHEAWSSLSPVLSRGGGVLDVNEGVARLVGRMRAYAISVQS